MMSRTEVQCFECPYCGANPTDFCISSRGKKRISNHRERWVVAEEWIRTGNSKFTSNLASHSARLFREQ